MSAPQLAQIVLASWGLLEASTTLWQGDIWRDMEFEVDIP